MPASAVRLQDAVVLLGRFPALAGVDLTVGRGEVVALRGANGAGKSTLLRLCAGLAPLAEGRGEVLGLDLATEGASVRRSVGLVGHATGLYDDLTVAENVHFWGAAAGAPSQDCAAAMDRLALGGRLRDQPTGALSSGQRRRVSIAAVVARRPELWLLDEPHAGLDSDGRDLIDELIGQAADQGATVLFASHEHERVARLSPRVVTVAGGVAVAGVEPVHARGEPDEDEGSSR